MVRLFSPAKLNLFFRVVKKREDGYHDIASIFQAIDLGDTLEIGVGEEDWITCSDKKIPLDETNLLFRALHLFREKTGIGEKIHFNLEKHIPTEAGLGGGSSNAATALWGLNTLFGKPATLKELLIWSAEIGSDVPFFLTTGSAYATGRGEVLEDLPIRERRDLFVIKPRGGLSTPLVFKHSNVASLSQVDPLGVKEKFLKGEPSYFNDLEEAAFSIAPSLCSLKQNLIEWGFSNVTMTGSGTAFFAFKGDFEDLPAWEGVSIVPVKYLFREEGEWYCKPASSVVQEGVLV